MLNDNEEDDEEDDEEDGEEEAAEALNTSFHLPAKGRGGTSLG